jgi:hypothetical protein
MGLHRCEVTRGKPYFASSPKGLPVPREYVSPTQAAEMYGISRRSIHRYVTQPSRASAGDK